MKRKATIAALALGLCAALPAAAQHRSVTNADLKWAPTPSLPAGAQVAVIEGPLNEAVPFTMRIRFPANYRLPAHTHPAIERVTVLSGVFHMGMGNKLDLGAAHAVRPGEMMVMQPGTPHFAFTEAETVVQLHGMGPWGINYIDPSDDPRRQKR